MQLNRKECPVCSNQLMEVFFEVESAPVFCNILWNSYEEAIAAPRAPIQLGYCNQCDMIYNVAFEPKLLEYAPEYENSLHFSPHFQQYAEGVVSQLVERYDLKDKDIIEIGCGQGDFLSMLQRCGNNHVLGFDPSYSNNKSTALSQQSDVKIIAQAYGQGHRRYPADFICCRHVLEHIAGPLEFLKNIRSTIVDQKDCVVYFEVPNALYILKGMGVWDIIYEHCSYFTTQSLANLFVRAGFEPIETTEQYDGQFLAIEARPCTGENCVPDKSWSTADTNNLIEKFFDAYREKLNFWKQKLGGLSNAKQPVVLWGAGSKGISFLNALDVSRQQIEYIVDINPRKNGRFVPGTGQEVVTPDFLKEYNPKTVIIMNPVYVDEIRQIFEGFSMSPEFLLA